MTVCYDFLTSSGTCNVVGGYVTGYLPEVEQFLSGTPYVHWGYLNSTQIVVKGKKMKKAKWMTLWLELCGSTLKLFKVCVTT